MAVKTQFIDVKVCDRCLMLERLEKRRLCCCGWAMNPQNDSSSTFCFNVNLSSIDNPVGFYLYERLVIIPDFSQKYTPYYMRWKSTSLLLMNNFKTVSTLTTKKVLGPPNSKIASRRKIGNMSFSITIPSIFVYLANYTYYVPMQLWLIYSGLL